MPRAKKRKSPAANSTQFARTVRKTGKWRGKVDPKLVKSGQKPKKIYEKMVSRIEYQKKYEDEEDNLFLNKGEIM